MADLADAGTHGRAWAVHEQFEIIMRGGSTSGSDDGVRQCAPEDIPGKDDGI